jgi:calcineurin-like phosphoesterase family protein
MLATVATALALLLSPSAPSPAQAARPATLIAFGDAASCSVRTDSAVAAVVARIPGTVAVLGDSVYERGTTDELRRCYVPVFGRFLARTRAALGNHDYGTGNADAAISTFTLPRRGWYSYELGAWHVVVLNSNCSPAGGCGPGSPQETWLRRDLAAHPTRCTLAYWHHPRWSSGLHGPDASMQTLWGDLARAGADVVLAGHDHHYERFAPIDGIRSFVVGTGGRSHYPVLFRSRGSQVVNDRTFGVLRLTLAASGYSWRFVPVAGSTFTDGGTARCR